MTDTEIDQATKALSAWFQSQSLSPKDAGIVMVNLIAQLLTAKTKDIPELQDAIRDTNNLLTIEIAGYLRK